MAKERTVVRFDWRNCGLSTRHVADVSPDAHLRDLLALQDHLGFEQVALRIHGSASIALRYAAVHPERVQAVEWRIASADGDERREVIKHLRSVGHWKDDAGS